MKTYAEQTDLSCISLLFIVKPVKMKNESKETPKISIHFLGETWTLLLKNLLSIAGISLYQVP